MDDFDFPGIPLEDELDGTAAFDFPGVPLDDDPVIGPQPQAAVPQRGMDVAAETAGRMRWTQLGQPRDKPTAQSMEPWEPSLWQRILSIGGASDSNKARAMNEYAAREIAAERGISVAEVYERAGGARPMLNPEGRPPIQAFKEGRAILVDQVPYVPQAAVNTIFRTIRGGDDDVEMSILDKAIEFTEPPDPSDIDPNYESLYGIGKSLGYSMATMVASALSYAAGSVVGGPVGGAITANVGGTVVPYRASKDEFLGRVKEKLDTDSLKVHGRKLNQKEWKKAYNEFESAAQKYGAWEAIPEAVSNLVFLRAFAAPLKGAAESVLPDVAKRAAITMFSEQTTETATGWGQSHAEEEAGIGTAKSIAQAFRDQAVQTAIVSGVMGAAGAAYSGMMGGSERISLLDNYDVDFSGTKGGQARGESPTAGGSAPDGGAGGGGQLLLEQPEQKALPAPPQKLLTLRQPNDFEVDSEGKAAPPGRREAMRRFVDEALSVERLPAIEYKPLDPNAVEVDSSGFATTAFQRETGEDYLARNYIALRAHTDTPLLESDDTRISRALQSGDTELALAIYDQREAWRQNANQAKLPPGFTDRRLLREEFRPHLAEMAGSLALNQNKNRKVDKDGNIIGRLPSGNPQWYQSLSSRFTVAQVQNAVTKALDGDGLGPRQAELIEIMLDEISTERSRYIPDVQQERRTLNMIRRSLMGGKSPFDSRINPYSSEAFPDDFLHDPAEYPEDFNDGDKALSDLIETALELGAKEDDIEFITKLFENGDVVNTAQAVRSLLQDIEGARNEGRGTDSQPGEAGPGSREENAGVQTEPESTEKPEAVVATEPEAEGEVDKTGDAEWLPKAQAFADELGRLPTASEITRKFRIAFTRGQRLHERLKAKVDAEPETNTPDTETKPPTPETKAPEKETTVETPATPPTREPTKPATAAALDPRLEGIDLSGRQVEVQATVRETGDVVVITEPAEDAIRQMDKRINMIQQLIECLKS